MDLRRRALELAFALSGFCALALQVVWQRVISIHSGVDLASSTTVVAAFMAGLGLGSALGGRLGERLSARAAVRTYGLATLGVALFALLSVPLFYDGVAHLGAWVDSTASSFVVHFLLLGVPTTLMGLSLPLLTKGVVRHLSDAPSTVGRLSAVNTFGAAAGAAVTTWLLLGNLGFQGTVWLLAGLDALAAGVVLVAFWGPLDEGRGESAAASAEPSTPSSPPWGWYALFALTGAVALGFEIVFFRVVDAIMRSNSYTFGHVLTLYLVLYATGAALGARWVRRTSEPGRAFLLAQLALALFALFGFLALVHMPETFGMKRLLSAYFATDGYLAGPALPTSGKAAARFLFAHLTGPLLIMGAPVLLMGVSFPLIMGAVARQGASVSGRVAGLQVANIAGNVLGSLVVGFVCLDVLGTMGTVKLLSAVLLALGGALVLRAQGRGRVAMGALLGVALGFWVGAPTNGQLWATLHSATEDRFTLVEERACVNAWVRQESGEEVLFLNATSQNGWPFDDFHVLIGLLPALLQDAPERALAVGLGAGSTAWGLLQDARLAQVRCVELCGGELGLLRALERRGAKEPTELLNDARARLEVGDGRKALLRDEQRYGVVTVDALRPNSAYSGSVYSLEFYELVKRRLKPGGIFSQWVPTGRVLNGVRRSFAHVVAVEIPGGRGRFLMGSDRPFVVDGAALLARFATRAEHFMPEQRARLQALFAGLVLEPVRAGEPAPELRAESFNTDLFPRDEYFLNDE